MAAGDANVGKKKSAICTACHGPNGIAVTKPNGVVVVLLLP